MSYYGKDTRTDHERYLEEELERERESQRERDRIEDERRKDRQREFAEARRYEERQADNWPEAFQKQANLCWREHNLFPEEENTEEFDLYFKHLAQANEKALEIWREVAASKKSKLDELQKQIEAVWDEVRNEVADNLIAVNDRLEYKSTAEAIRDDQLSGYLDW